MEFNVFYSWQSDLPITKRYISSCLNKIAKKDYDGNIISISSDARNSNGSVNLTQTLFRKIRDAHVFVADLSIINSARQNDRKSCNPNVLIELGYAINCLGIDNIILLFDTKYGQVEDLPFDIRQNKIIKFNSDKDKKSLEQTLTKEILSIIESINPSIYDYLYSEINNIVIFHFMEFTKMFYFNSTIKQRHDYSYFISKNQQEIESDIEHNTFLGFEIFNNLSLVENDFENFLNQQTNSSFLGENISKLLSKILLSMKALSKFLNYEQAFTQVDTLSPEYFILPAKKINPYNDDKLVLLKKSGNPLNNEGVVISGNYIYPNKMGAISNIYKCTNPKYFSLIIKNYIDSIVEWSKYTNDFFFEQLNQISKIQIN